MARYTYADIFGDEGLSGNYLPDPDQPVQDRTSGDPLTKLYHQARDRGMTKKQARSAAFAVARGIQPKQPDRQSGW
jgi:hypothetical protein